VTVPPLLDKARQAAEKVGLQCIVIGSAEDHVLLASLLESDPLVSPPEVDARNDTVVLAFSSATTGFAKAVMLTHRNMVANLCQIHSTHHLAAADTIIAVLPFFHIYGMQLLMNLALRSGATVVTMPRFDLEEFLWAIQEHRVTRACLVPPIVVALAKHPLVDAYDLSSLELILCGAAPLSAAVAEACAARLGCPVVQGYGMTEASPVTHLIPDGVPSKPGSVGPSVSRCEWQIVDTESGAGLGIAEVGEICVRGPQVMKGYLNNPVATATAVNPEGWLRTGDIGYADEDGYLFVVDRLEELIKHRGLLIAPSELESQLLAHPAVADAAVVPIPDAEAGEVPKAFVVLKEGSSLDDIVRFVAGRVAPHKRIREVEVVDEIPKSPSGKILRRVLVGRERERRTQENPRI